MNEGQIGLEKTQHGSKDHAKVTAKRHDGRQTVPYVKGRHPNDQVKRYTSSLAKAKPRSDLK